MTHSPPQGVLDKIFTQMRVGCEVLAERLAELEREGRSPRYHIFGHIHESRGVLEKGGTTYINACSVNLRYQPRPENGGAWMVFDM